MKYFVYYSLSGNGDFIAKKLKDKGYQPIKAEMVKPIKKGGFFTMMKYGFRAGLSKKEKIKELNIDLKDDDEVIIGSPIWNDRLSTPINTVLAVLSLNRKTTNFIVYPAGESAKKVFNQIKALGFEKEPIIYPHPLKDESKVKAIIDCLK